ncbi:MAG: NAD(P)-dependent oxidoreductase [Candidatus Korobacteraceae bacterium]
MKVFVAGATGAIGRPLIKSLTLAGHTAFGMVRAQSSSSSVSEMGAEPVIADALDAASVSGAVAKVRPDVIINELTSLPKHYTPTDMEAAAEGDARVRSEGNRNLIAAALQTGVRRFLVQSTGFWYAPGEGLAEESEGFAFSASPGVAAGAQRYAELEAVTLGRPELQSVALRYGFFYGPGTWFTSDGDVGEQVRQQQVPAVGDGQGVWSWVHIDDAADATVRALDCAPGAYNIVDENPSEQRVWLSAFARYCGAPEPPHVSEQQALQAAGADEVYYATRLRGASNAKAKRELGFTPRPLQWLATK